MAASHNPEKFFWKPPRLTTHPVWLGKSPYAVDPLVRIRRTKCIKPAVKRDGIIIEKNYY